MKKDILIIGDAHARPGISNERFTWLGKYACDKQPDIIIDMGDWADMPSLSSYDIGKKSYEGRRYIKDISSAVEARELFNTCLQVHAKRASSRHKTKYSPEKIALGGNHCEGRITRVIEEDSKLDGLIGIEDLQYEEFGWDYVPYRTPANVQGFTFCHYFSSGVMGRPIGGEMPALSLLRKQFCSCVSGHLHLFDVAHRTRPDGSRIWGFFAGSFMAEEQWETYAHQANKLWWKGLILLKGCENGDFDEIETITIQELKRRYA